MSYFDVDDSDSDETEPDTPFREVGQVGKMPIHAPYDYDRIERWAQRALSHLRNEGRATDADLVNLVDLDAISRDAGTYDPSQYRREAVREHTGRGSTKRAHEEAKRHRETDRKRLFYAHRAPVLSTHEHVEWRSVWRLDSDEAPAGGDTVRDIAESFDISNYPRKVVRGMFEALVTVADDQDRGASTYELLTSKRVPDVDQETLDEAARFLAQEVPGVRPPETCEYISWADAGGPSWLYLPSVETTGDAGAAAEEVADV